MGQHHRQLRQTGRCRIFGCSCRGWQSNRLLPKGLLSQEDQTGLETKTGTGTETRRKSAIEIVTRTKVAGMAKTREQRRKIEEGIRRRPGRRSATGTRTRQSMKNTTRGGLRKETSRPRLGTRARVPSMRSDEVEVPRDKNPEHDREAVITRGEPNLRMRGRRVVAAAVVAVAAQTGAARLVPAGVGTGVEVEDDILFFQGDA
mmetsp:Transcript_43840/g.80065  ORF Transcript_43840/g.80065 Transcript_43840/m.80065 type:complete len:203 (-) Transcript_43840:91-699(-)